MRKKLLILICCCFFTFYLTACDESDETKLDDCIEAEECTEVVINSIEDDNSELSIKLRDLELSDESLLSYTFSKVNKDSGKFAFTYTVDGILSQTMIESSKDLFVDIEDVLDEQDMSYNIELKVIFSDSKVELLCTEDLCSVNIYLDLESSDLFSDSISNNANVIKEIANMDNQITHVYFIKDSAEVTLYFELSTSRLTINYKDILNEEELTAHVNQEFPNYEIID